MSPDIYKPSRSLLSKLRRRRAGALTAQPVAIHLRRPIVSFCFDDFPANSVKIGARALEHFGVRGAYYACASYAGATTHLGRMYDADDLDRLAEHGHEIGCHTNSHLDCAQSSPRDCLDDIAANREGLERLGLNNPLRTFCYPYGETSVELKRQISDHFLCARGIVPKLNVGTTDFAQLGAIAMYGRDYEKRCVRAIASAARRKAWLIFFTHDVCAKPTEWGTETRVLEKLIQKSLQSGAEVLTVAEAGERILAGSH